MHVHTYIFTYIYVYINTYLYTFVSMYLCIYVSMYLCIYIYTYIGYTVGCLVSRSRMESSRSPLLFASWTSREKRWCQYANMLPCEYTKSMSLKYAQWFAGEQSYETALFVFEARRLGASLNSMLESNKEEGKNAPMRTPKG